ncbi:putative exoV-like protein [Acanthamoeba polyphaga mimivirus]|nr:putative exoV-like protein [Mimivirus reunion]WMV61489.1 putative exoV-like protein [Mimivirus sp.]WMV62466.1 putative exoV-like protein [Acanthamoeba polyphaga mimivirus]WMV63443.1 putative exoV-like protein [Mimivirus sp.]
MSLETHRKEIYIHYFVKDVNAGDRYNKFMAEKLVDAKVVCVTCETINYNPHFQFVGSIASSSNKNTVILGTGLLLQSRYIKAFKECHIVRGKYTLIYLKAFMKDVSSITLGDPGILLECFIDKENRPEPVYEYGIIPHYVDKARTKELMTPEWDNKVLYIDIQTDDLVGLAKQMLSCKKMVSSSLHGIIFAHSLGIPVTWVRFDGTKLTPDDIKFYDYLSVFGIERDQYKKYCTLIQNSLSLNDFANFPTIDIDATLIANKKQELLSKTISVLRKHNFRIRDEFSNY